MFTQVGTAAEEKNKADRRIEAIVYHMIVEVSVLQKWSFKRKRFA